MTQLPIDDVLARVRTVIVDGLEVPTLDIVDTLLHMASHTSTSGGHRLVRSVDLDRAVRVDGLPDDLVDRARRAGLGSALSLLLRRCRRDLGTPVDRVLLSALAGSRVWTAGAVLAGALQCQ